ncbi:MAG: hypothetical protein K0Q90_173 [Paenibacillaceae bacterium]|jgi:hypothetical protein|nr:hypothetical protein [Paenibacillaceae bacterium]
MDRGFSGVLQQSDRRVFRGSAAVGPESFQESRQETDPVFLRTGFTASGPVITME